MTNARGRAVRFVASSLVALAMLSAAAVAPAQDASSLGSPGWSVLRCDGTLGLLGGQLQVAVAGGTRQDHRFACAAMRRAIAFFLGHGLRPDLRLRVEFREAVFLDLSGCMYLAGLAPSPCADRTTTGDIDASGAPAAFAPAERVVGIFHPGSRTVLMTTEASSWLRSYTYFELPVNDEMFTSMLTHEITHAMSKSLYAPVLRVADHDIHVQEEYVAYVAQLSTMSRDLRTAVLARYPAAAHRFNDEADINAMSLGLSPEAFGVKSYRHFMEDAGGPVFLRRIYGGEYRPPVQILY